MKKLPLALCQSCWVYRVGEKYRSKCEVCKIDIDCFNFQIAWYGGCIDFDILKIVCKKCYRDLYNMI